MNHLQTSELCATAQLSILDTELHSKQEFRAEVSMPTCLPHRCFAELFLPRESPLLSLRHVASEKTCSVSERVCSFPVLSSCLILALICLRRGCLEEGCLELEAHLVIVEQKIALKTYWHLEERELKYI